MSLRLLLAVGLLAVFLYFVGAAELAEVVSSVQPLYVFYLFLISVVMIWASCLKWRLFIEASGRSVPMVHLMKLYTIGYFFNLFTPSSVGGDLIRSFQLGKHLASQRDAFIATFLERFTGLLAMALLGAGFALSGAKATTGLTVSICILAVVAVILAAACFSATFGRFSFRLTLKVNEKLPAAISRRLGPLIGKLDEGMETARNSPRLFRRAMILSLFFHVLTVANTYIAARAIGWEQPDIGGLFVVVPLTLIISMVPITPNGLGIQEGAFLFLLQRIGASRGEGLAVGLLLRAKVLVLAAFGGLLWCLMNNKRSIPLASEAKSHASDPV